MPTRVHTPKSTDRISRARHLDAEFKRLLRAGRKAEAEVCALVLEMKERKLYKPLRFTSLAAYCKAAAHWSNSKTAKIVALAGKLRELPHFSAAFLAGDIDWTKAYFVSTVATPETDEQWAVDAQKLTLAKLKRKAAELVGEQPRTLFQTSLTDDQRAPVDAAIARVRAERSEPMTAEQALAEVARRSMADPGTIGGARREVIIKFCPSCEKASVGGHDGQELTLSKTHFEREACALDVVDMTGEHEDLSRTIPTKVKNFIDRRDERKCKVPGCERTSHLEYHHQGGWRTVGHNPECTFLVCSTHHDVHHDGELKIVEVGRGLYVFSTADGEEIGQIDISLAPKDRKRFGLAAVAPRAEEFHVEQAPAEDRVELATRFLESLQLGRTEARALAQQAAMGLPADASVDTIVTAALRARPDRPAPRLVG